MYFIKKSPLLYKPIYTQMFSAIMKIIYTEKSATVNINHGNVI